MLYMTNTEKVVIITRNKNIARGYAKWRAENDRI